MGDKITIENIELLSSGLFQIDFRNETTGELYRTFVGHDKLYDMLLVAKRTKDDKDAQFNILKAILHDNNDGYTLTNEDIDVASNRIANYGVIVPPCKVGSTVYLPNLTNDGDLEHYIIISFKYDNEYGLQFQVDDEDGDFHEISMIGTEVFLYKDEAIKQMHNKRLVN